MKRILFIILSILTYPALSQVTINDAGLLSCIRDSFPSIMIDLVQFDTIASKSISVLNCNNKGITDITALQYFDGLEEINLEGNSITSITPIQKLPVLRDLSVKENSISILPSLSELYSLKVFNAEGNEISVFPDFVSEIQEIYLSENLINESLDLSSLTDLEKIHIGNNSIDSLNGLLSLTKLRGINLENNGLTFIESLKNCDSLESIILNNNQLTKITGIDDKLKLVELKLNQNNLSDVKVIALAQFATVDLQENAFTFSDLEPIGTSILRKSGDWNYIPQDIVKVEDNINLNNGDNFEWTLDFDQDVINNSYQWFHNGNLIQTTTSGSLFIPNVTSSNSGGYTCTVSNSNLPGLSLKVEIVLLTVIDENSENNEPLAFSPRGINGTSDTFLFNKQGEVEIYDRFSNQVRKENGPFEWNGMDQNGQLLPVGVYVVRINGEFWNQISIIR